ncbi:hypothetical protein DNK49_03715 [Azoarcus communis]|uniref:HipA-like C-terminal domain-containing protein n=1 Tax=Parazoarcus communis SWub3 = DSM 12120 TaxID=1121029 RepID=A0A323UZC9_9RHOO|nr:HipA domain-containing protein [Parazoarcus communis]PZA17949.1 hypothetical protein DNK49_03715 [Azoarcus communis] [Parazoarcus communis SWub3 = DSM 12120]
MRVVAPGKVDDLCLGQRQAIGGKYLAQCEVVEVAGRHVGDCTGFARGVALAIRRFDRAQGRRLPALSAHAAAVELSYPNLAQLLRRRGDVEIHRSQMHELFRRLVFNILIDNTDNHEKNHVLLVGQAQQYVLAPAFDVLPMAHSLGYQAMAVGERGTESSIENVLSAAGQYWLAPAAAMRQKPVANLLPPGNRCSCHGREQVMSVRTGIDSRTG